MSELAKRKVKNQPKMTLRGYYSQLPDASHPKTDFMNAIAMEAGVSVASVRNWVIYGMKPQNKKHIDILVRMTGIPAEDLWED